MTRDALLAIGVVMPFASQIDVPGIPFGYGELCLFLWIALSVVRILAGGRTEITPTLVRLASFWTIFALALGVGTLVGYFTDILYLTGIWHDGVAYVLLVCMTCLAAAEPDAYRHLRRSAWWVIAIANATLAIQLMQASGWIPQAGVELWYWDRFRGWSLNPNQIALYCAAFGPLALYLATTTNKPIGKVLGFAGMILPFYVGRLTKSDTFLYTSVLGWLIFLGLRLRTWLAAGRGTLSYGRQAAMVLILAALPLTMALAPFGLTELGNAESFAKSLTKDKGGEATAETAELRMYLWEQAVRRGLASASLGLGPGAHLERPNIVETGDTPRPFEAHSTLLDLYTQGGLVAVGALIWLVGAAAVLAWQAKLDAMLALLVSLGVFSLPHLIIRHPIVWFALTLCLVAGTTPNATAASLREG
ncbi:MAG: polymerase [Candidatus Kaistia colombiensis]|nr:MAG: polymerase [Kaistia sp.]